MWPLVGRDAELELLGERFEAGDEAAVVLTGPAGVGKSRLAATALAGAEDRGFRTVRVIATRATRDVAFGALIPLIDSGEALPQSRHAVMHAVATSITSLGAGRRLVFFVDDAHHLDEPSAGLIHQLAADGRMSVLATIRTPEPFPEDVARLWQPGVGRRIDLQPLSRTETDHLVRTACGGPVEAGALKQIWAASEGNPLYLRELVTTALAEGALAEAGGLRRLTGPLSAPPTLVELVERTLHGLTQTETELLELLAVADTIGLSLLEARFGTPMLEKLEARRLIDVGADGLRRPVRFAHPMYGEVLADTMPALRVRERRRSAADLIEAAGARRRGDALTVALLRLEADGTADRDLLARAARQACTTFDLDVAERLADAALHAGAGAEAERLLANIYRWQGDGDHAEECFADIDVSALPAEERALLAAARAENLFRGLGRTEQAVQVLDEATASMAPGGSRDIVRAMHVTIDLVAGDVNRVLERGPDLLESCHGLAASNAAVACAVASAVAGRIDDAIELSDHWLGARVERTDAPLFDNPSELLVIAKCVALTEAGRLDEAEMLALAGYEYAITTGLLLGQAWIGMLLSRVRLGRGQLGTAEGGFGEAALAFRALGDPGVERWCWAGVAQAAAQRADVATATAAVDEIEQASPHPVGLMEVEVDRGRAWTAAAGGAHGEARSRLREAADRARDLGQHSLEATALADVTRLGEATDIAPRVGELAEVVEGPLMEARAEHAAALAAADGPRLDRSSDAFEATGMLLVAAEAAAQAGHAHRGAGHRRAASASARRASELRARCEGAHTPALATGDEPTPLTAREREIASMAAAGSSGRQIAEALCISQRTVNNHLQRVYAKLGVSGRDELRETVGGAGYR